MIELKRLYNRSPRLEGGTAIGMHSRALDALRLVGVTTVEHVTLPSLHATPDFGRTSTAFLCIALADEVLRLQGVVSQIGNALRAVQAEVAE